MNKRIEIKSGDIHTAVLVSKEIPEFDIPPAEAEYRRRLEGVPHLILIAYAGQKPVGFKVGYQKEDYFYSWMGGVIPAYRGMGIARLLAARQEDWVKKKGYKELVFKTRNQHKGMLIFALKNGFNIVGFTPKEEELTNRILLRKVF